MREYVIWGVPFEGREEVLLLTKVQGEPITSMSEAKALKLYLETNFGAKAVRIQTIELFEDPANLARLFCTDREHLKGAA